MMQHFYDKSNLNCSCVHVGSDNFDRDYSGIPDTVDNLLEPEDNQCFVDSLDKLIVPVWAFCFVLDTADIPSPDDDRLGRSIVDIHVQRNRYYQGMVDIPSYFQKKFGDVRCYHQTDMAVVVERWHSHTDSHYFHHSSLARRSQKKHQLIRSL